LAERFELLTSLLKGVNRGVHELAKGIIHGHALAPPSLMVMRRVFEDPGITVSELSRQTSMAKSHVSRTVESLTQAGLLEKRADPSDHRLLRIHPTGTAEAHFRQMHSAVRRRFAAVISTLPDEKVDALIEGLQAVQAALERAHETDQGERNRE